MINPVNYYQLDPGEFGMALPATASDSAIKVIGHEIGNLNRFRMQAMQEGGTLVYAKISVTTQLEGPLLAVVSGKTDVEISHPEATNNTPPKATNSTPTEIINPSSGSSENNGNQNKPQVVLNTPSVNENTQDNGDKKLVAKLKTADNVLTAKLNNIKLQETKFAGDNSPSSKAKMQELQKTEKNIKDKLKYVENNITKLSMDNTANKAGNLNNVQNNSIGNFSYSNEPVDMFLKGLFLNVLA